MNKIFLTLALLVMGLTLNAQYARTWYLSQGGNNVFVQNTNYSSSTYSGVGFDFDIGYERKTQNSIIGSGLSLGISSTVANTSEINTGTVFQFDLNFKYLCKISDKLYLGGKWDILGLNLHSISGLGNNSSQYVSFSDFLASADYQLTNRFSLGLDLGILSFQKDNNGFAFSAQQSILEDGGFNYQDDGISNPIPFSHSRIVGFPSALIVKSNLTYTLSNRFQLGYQWDIRRFSSLKDYSYTTGSHSIVLRWNFSRKDRSSTSES